MFVVPAIHQRRTICCSRGEDLDVRTDLFSFGAVLYEMATGQHAFSGRTSGVIFESILNREPTSARQLNSSLPIELEQIVCKALEKDRDVRYQHAADVRADLKRLKRDSESGKFATRRTIPLRLWSSPSITMVEFIVCVNTTSQGLPRRSTCRICTGCPASLTLHRSLQIPRSSTPLRHRQKAVSNRLLSCITRPG
jgi:serine/threonine protein kinase